jgi:hypothetical protein
VGKQHCNLNIGRQSFGALGKGLPFGCHNLATVLKIEHSPLCVHTLRINSWAFPLCDPKVSIVEIMP